MAKPTNTKDARRRRDRRKGQALVESALVLVIVIAMIVGIMDFAQLMMFHQLFTERVRAGVRYAVVNAYDPVTVTNFVLYNSPTAPSGNPPGMFGLVASNVTVTRFNAGDRTLDRIQVRIANVPMRFLSVFIAGSFAHRPVQVTRSVESLGATG